MSRIALVQDLTPIREAAKAEINTAAEKVRLRFITPGDGKMLSYQKKAKQAAEIIARRSLEPGWEPSPQEFPILAGTIGKDRHPVTGEVATSVLEVAHIISFLEVMWEQIEAVITQLCADAISAVDLATNYKEIRAATAVNWESLLG